MGETREFTLLPGQGLKQLKKDVRRNFGKVSHTRLSSFNLEGSTGPTAKSTDLGNEVTVYCNYISVDVPLAFKLNQGDNGRHAVRSRQNRAWKVKLLQLLIVIGEQPLLPAALILLIEMFS